MARRRSRQTLFYGLVCEDCLEAKPWNTELLNTECEGHKSSTVVLVHVAININEGILERVRPLPTMLPSGKFILCKNADGWCDYEDNCTYAHSKVEQKAWNAQLTESEDDNKSEGEFF